MVDFELSEEQRGLREVSRQLLADRWAPAAARAAIGGADADAKLWELGTGLGWTGLAVPEADGGLGQGIAELALVAEELGRAAGRGPFTSTALAALAVARHGTDALRALALPALTRGSASAALAVAEAGGWSPGAVRLETAANAAGGGPAAGSVLSGRKTLVADADTADWLLVTALASDGPVLVLVESAAPGVAIRRQETLDLTRNLYEVTFDGVPADADRRLAGGAAASQWLLDAAAVLTAADALGSGERLLELTVEHAKAREQFGRPLGSFQAVKHKAADMRLLVTGARAAVYYAAMALDAAAAPAPAPAVSEVSADEASEAASTAKSFVSSGMARLAGEALQTHGGIGFTWEHDLHLYLRRIKADEQFYGDAALHNERLAGFLIARNGR